MGNGELHCIKECHIVDTEEETFFISPPPPKMNHFMENHSSFATDKFAFVFGDSEEHKIERLCLEDAGFPLGSSPNLSWAWETLHISNEGANPYRNYWNEPNLSRIASDAESSFIIMGGELK